MTALRPPRADEVAAIAALLECDEEEVDLGAVPTEPASPPPDVVIRPFRRGEERAVYDVHAESFADALDRIDIAYEEWLEDRVEHPSFDPSLWLVAEGRDELAGIALSRMRAERGWVGILGVRARWRRRGLGMALLQAVVAEFGRRGVRTVGLRVDAESPTGALRLYERAGMNVVAQFDTYERELG